MKKQEYEQKSHRLNQIRNEIESNGYSLEYSETDGAKLYKNDEFVYIQDLQPLLDEYFNLKLTVDAHTEDWDGSFKK